MKYVFTFDEDRCSACGACRMGCIDQNDIDIESGESCFRRTYEDEIELKDGGLYCVYLSAACMHCENAPCIDACPAGCIKKDQETGFTVYDNTNCIGCKSCALACPFGAPVFRKSDGKMVKCDGCNIRVKNGLKPACVRACSFGALDCVAEADFNASEGGKACSQLLKNLGLQKYS
ncbi:dimethylsulfoxide reductase [Pseudoflavonifractor sp. 524-17]|uniref:4Fe-4S dicluster domain-containing protein n=1 Tax=Pseudoflavonifractor sp. 524-17 TaxID=2304577 RepID=UPI00137B0A82|nr:4Fe-4S dicluster domain-containing protein [Pseudoflavonifractor sp. 524-17]NCE66227.1 dimethylsulfoxide reductase [Pseudoflavonifractor sp. 524-17]